MGPPAPSYDELVALVRDLRERVAVLERENADLRRRLDGKPPPPPAFARPSVPARRGRKAPGRPAGHPPALRPPPPEIHAEVAVPLPAGGAGPGGCLCPHCRGELDDVRDHERVVEDIVPARPVVTRYHTRSGYCRHCRRRVESRHADQPPPADVPHAQLGLTALAAAAALKHDAGLPYRKVARVLGDLCGLTVSHGALPKQVRRLAGWLSAPGGAADAIRDRLRAGTFANVDETGWRVGGVNHWLWALTNPDCTLYRFDRRRSSEVVRRVLGERYAGTVVSDFLPTYDRLPYKAQKCIPHLLRDVEKTSARSPPFAASPFRKRLKRAAKDLLRLKSRWDELGDDAYFLRVSRLADRLDGLAGTVSADPDVRRLAARLDRHADALAAFLLDKDLPGDNNAAERAIRPAVIIRKVSGGHRGGSTATASAVVMSVLRTVRQQGRHLIDTVKELVQAHLAGKPCNLFTSAAQ